MNVLIAEDEWIERKSMCKFIHRNLPEMTIVGEAKNGREAVEMTEKLKPDIILMDIKMPGMSGIEAVKQIKSGDHQVKIAMVSAYDSFEYAKEAMRYGIKDYILKPSQPEEIIEALKRMQDDIIVEKEQTKLSKKSKELARTNFLNNLLTNGDAHELKRMRETLFPSVVSNCFYVLIADKTIDKAVLHQVDPILKDDYIISMRNQFIVIYQASNSLMHNKTILSIAQEMHYVLGDSYYIGASYATSKIEDAYESFREAYVASYTLRKNQGRSYGFLTKDVRQPDVNSQDLYTLLEINQVEGAFLLFQAYDCSSSISWKEQLYIDIKNRLQDEHAIHLSTSFSSLQSDTDWKQFFYECSIAFQEIHQRNQSIEQIKQYIEENYQSNLTLEAVANIVRLSPNYFSNLFKQQTEKTLTEYITTVRMTKAKEFIFENKHTLKEICFLVGYNEPNYFSRVFKKYYGHSPKQFQSQICK